MTKDLPPHGDWGRYTNHGCRCEPCRAENSARLRQYRATGSTVISDGPRGAETSEGPTG